MKNNNYYALPIEVHRGIIFWVKNLQYQLVNHTYIEVNSFDIDLIQSKFGLDITLKSLMTYQSMVQNELT